MPGANPAALVGMISTVQMMSMKKGMQMGETPASLEGLAGGVGWANLDFSGPVGSRRRLRETHPYRSATNLVVVTVAVLVPLALVHYRVQQKKRLTGIMCFPQIESIVGLMLINPYTKCAAGLFQEGTRGGVAGGVGLLLMVPIPMLVWSVWMVRAHVLSKKVKFIVFHPMERVHGPYDFLKRMIRPTNQGHWKDKEQTLDRFGIFFKSIRGPLYVFRDREVWWNEKTRRYQWGKVELVPDKLAGVRAYYKSYFIFRSIFVALLLNAFSYSPHGNLVQLGLLLTVFSGHFYLMAVASPFNTTKDQFTDICSGSCEAGIYATGVGLIYARRVGSLWLERLAEKVMMGLQLSSVGVHVLTQLWGVVVMAGVLMGTIQQRFFSEEMLKRKRELVLVKKYGARWLRRCGIAGGFRSRSLRLLTCPQSERI